MKPGIFENSEVGIKEVYRNEKWVACIKNWKPDNDRTAIVRLEVHHSTDEQFIPVAGKAILITASRAEDHFDMTLTLMEPGKVYDVPKETWFNTVTNKDTKLVYVQDANCSADNSEYIYLTDAEKAYILEEANKMM